MTIFYFINIWIILDLVALDLISRRKNGMVLIWEMYEDWKKLDYFLFKVFTVVYLFFMLPLTIPSSVYKLIKKRNNG